MSKRIDLHIHTIASDGTWNPKETVENAIKNNIGIFAVADHDETKNILETEKRAKENNISFIRAIEFTCKAFDKEYHILGYDLDIDNADVQKRIKKTVKNRYIRDTKIVEMLVKNYNFDVSIEEFEEFRKKPMTGIPSINYLKEKNIANDLKTYIYYKDQVMLSKDEDLPSVEEVIPIIKRAGGVAVLAHPSYYFPKSVMPTNQLDYFKDLKIDGIECYCNYNKPKENFKYYTDYCKKYDIAISAGSDCHGGTYKDRRFGDPYVTLDMTNIISRMRNYKYLQSE